MPAYTLLQEQNGKCREYPHSTQYVEGVGGLSSQEFTTHAGEHAALFAPRCFGVPCS